LATLYKDKALVRNIVERLRALGYVGPDFGPSDPGLQDKKLVVLEAPEQFSVFAKSKGWKNLAEEFDDE
jgi:predicted transcriptional regulator